MSELGALVHRQHAAGAGGPAKAEGDEPREQRVPTDAYTATSDLLRSTSG